MDAEERCRVCGDMLPSGAANGRCPDSLLQEGARWGDSATDDPVPAQETGSYEPVVSGMPDEPGEGPRVHLRDSEAETGPGPVVRPASPEMPGPDDQSDRFEILDELARGGMGAILKGHDPRIGRDLAVKVLLEQHRSRDEMVRRFNREAQITGQLQHPGIVPVHEMGEFTDQRPYFAMKLVKGHTLAAMLKDRSDPAHELPKFLGIFDSICQTMAYVHSRGVIHRDLKPLNVMVGSFGEVQVMDWGLAKVLQRPGSTDDETNRPGPVHETVITISDGISGGDKTRAQSVLGTPSYMAPEQAQGRVEVVDERCDVFALGSTLCEILTGRPAFTGRDGNEIMRKAKWGDLADASARLDACGADPELVALVRECLARDSEDRPRHAGIVAERIRSYVTGVQERLRAAELALATEEVRAEEAQHTARAAEAARAAERKRAEEAEARRSESETAAQRQTQLSRRLLIAAVVAGMLAVTSGVLALRANKARYDADIAASKASKSKDEAIEARKKADHAALLAKISEQNAKAQAGMAESRRLAVLSDSLKSERLDLAMLLAIQAANDADTLEARGCLQRSLDARPEVARFLHVPEGGVSSVAFGPAGSWNP
jgi:hypothetical protein